MPRPSAFEYLNCFFNLSPLPFSNCDLEAPAPLTLFLFRYEEQVRSHHCHAFRHVLRRSSSLNGYRSRALEKIAFLSADSTNPKDLGLEDLYNGCAKREADGKKPILSQAPISTQELDLLFALCKAVPLVQTYENAAKLFTQLSQYLLEAHVQSFHVTHFLRAIEPSPWEALTFQLTKAILTLGLNHHGLHQGVLDCTKRYLQNCLESASQSERSQSPNAHFELGQHQNVASLAVSLLGFLEAVCVHASFYTGGETLEVIGLLKDVMNEQYLVSLEAVLSSIRASESTHKRTTDWHSYTKRYDVTGRPLGAKLLRCTLMRLLVSCSSLLIGTPERLQEADTFQILTSGEKIPAIRHDNAASALLELLAGTSADSMRLLDNDSDYIRLSSHWQQHLAYSAKAHSLHTYLNCTVVDEEAANTDILMSWLLDAMADSASIADDVLATVVLKSLAVVSKNSPVMVAKLSRKLPKFIVQGKLKGQTVDVAAWSLLYILNLISQDAVITGIYTLGNVLSSGSNTDRVGRIYDQANGTARFSKAALQQDHLQMHHADGSAISLVLSDEEEATAAYANVVRAVVCIATISRDDRIAALAQSMLLQKLGRLSLAVDLHIIRETASLALIAGEGEFRTLLKLYNRLGHEGSKTKDSTLLAAVRNARLHIAGALPHESPLYPIYLTSLLEAIISKGDVHERDNTKRADVDLAAREILELLPALATLASVETEEDEISDDPNVARLHREAWFNVIVHGITPSSAYGQQCNKELRVLAMKSRALVADDRNEQYESDIDLNTVLRRGMNGPNIAEQKKVLMNLLPKCESEVRSLSYPKVVFLIATYYVESLRAEAGDCAHILTYFLDSGLDGNAMESCMSAIADHVVGLYLQTILQGINQNHSAPSVAKQLVQLFMGCCHRMPRVQQVAFSSVGRIVGQIPSALCQRSSLYALLELLTIMWASCLEAELDEYELKSRYTSTRGNVSVELSDDYDHRRRTLDGLYKAAKAWMTRVIDSAPLDVKGLLQTYLSEYEDDGAYGHVAMGRNFAIDMGSVIPAADQKLSEDSAVAINSIVLTVTAAIDRHGDCNINTASDFIAQYTTRQEYKHADTLPDYSLDRSNLLPLNGGPEKHEASFQEDINAGGNLLESLERRAVDGQYISISELRDSLRRAAALLCRTHTDQTETVQQLVGIPFNIFTKQSIKLGISLWLNVINENPRMEPRILAAIADGWEKSVQNRNGAFSRRLNHLDPFYIKEEFAPSEKHVLLKRQQAAHDLIAPHLRLLQFLTSHFTSGRLGSPHTQRIFQRIANVTLDGLKDCAGHPLAREFYFQVVLFGLNVLKYGTGMGRAKKWLLKDRVLSAGLSWFAQKPRWSFGGNRLQIKAECRLMTDVEAGLRSVLSYAADSHGSLPSLASKHELLIILLENEQTRLMTILCNVLTAAWSESARLAVHLANRFPSVRLHNEVRALLLRYPEKALEEPDALQILIGPSLPSDISFQLKFLLYWAPVNPVTAVTYFLPEFNNNPFLIQYAVRALESHPIDITFFYVPQIVQTLRYDVLGYVQRYILETAKFSQLFAHQIIWNMTANAYKDEDSSVADSLKPTLDIIKDRMVMSFSGGDRDFYEREFTFFDEITGISGKLRPFIKKSKPEKKQKIEEELRKIKVDVGVYLPSNPEGTVIGIDRKSGKPLQSHAKAPYMATFRIKKSRLSDPAEVEEEQETANGIAGNGIEPQQSSYEVWQSAIFKVGDDCRQDILALQMIAAFRGIFNDVGLDVFVYPYRVTATAPGCGVIDVLPKSISRDMLGREAINGLYEYFISKYGSENSIAFQEARNNFVKSMAAYSVISYLLQFKDRHNGNIMIDDAGHILHIDFGFCFDIAPGGVRFERAPFKLTSEMIAVMGGNMSSQPFKWFEELCVKAFLASRPHTEKLCHLVVLMLGSGLPCFKPETIKHLRERFVLEKSEREAADFMKDLVKKSYGSYSTKGYDQFQLLTNGIPY